MHVIASDKGQSRISDPRVEVDMRSQADSPQPSRHLRRISRGSSTQTPKDELEDRLFSPRLGPTSLGETRNSPGRGGNGEGRSRRQQVVSNWAEIQDHLQHLASAFTQSDTFRNLSQEIAGLKEEAREAGHRRGDRVYGDGNFGAASARTPDSGGETGVKWNARPTWGTQFVILSGRTFKNMYRNPGLLQAHYVISLLVAGELCIE